jgi:hypothetical protein
VSCAAISLCVASDLVFVFVTVYFVIPEREADHSLSSSAEVKIAWSCTSTHPIRLHGVVLSQAQGQLYLIFTFYFVMTQSGNFWIHPRMRNAAKRVALVCCAL